MLPCRRPSEIVEKILHTLKERERELRRKNSALSWTTTSSYGASAIPTRFRVMDPQRPTFESIVEAVVVQRRPEGDPPPGPRTFKAVARSVLSVENRQWREDGRVEGRGQERRRMVIGGRAYLVDEEGNEEEEVLEDGLDMRHRLEHQDSRDSLVSTTSLDSDWSDEEREELERMFGAMSERGEEQTKIRQLRRSLRRSRRKRSQGAYSSGYSQGAYSSGTPSSCTLRYPAAA